MLKWWKDIWVRFAVHVAWRGLCLISPLRERKKDSPLREKEKDKDRVHAIAFCYFFPDTQSDWLVLQLILKFLGASFPMPSNHPVYPVITPHHTNALNAHAGGRNSAEKP